MGWGTFLFVSAVIVAIGFARSKDIADRAYRREVSYSRHEAAKTIARLHAALVYVEQNTQDEWTQNTLRTWREDPSKIIPHVAQDPKWLSEIDEEVRTMVFSAGPAATDELIRAFQDCLATCTCRDTSDPS